MLNCPEEYYKGLQVRRIEDTINSPNLPVSTLKNELGLVGVRAILVLAVTEVCNFFNVGKSMNATQVAMTVDLIIEKYFYLKLEDIKLCFRRAMYSHTAYDRIDGNVILSWLERYDADRDEYCSLHSINVSKSHKKEDKSAAIGCSYDEYWDGQRKLAEGGDKEAIERVKHHDELVKVMSTKKTFVSQPFIVRQIEREKS
ncbi:hypothetical protein [Bacteroides nordii]|uniref:hypothetical protein n=1 Tax=Bacteroides nordii TaxID=291645 RepID=UPI001E5C280B|nr:hypothetical protein [Bacteroides nordii]